MRENPSKSTALLQYGRAVTVSRPQRKIAGKSSRL
jgi:hypothetical protein